MSVQRPFRADHVGSFLRPRRLIEAREKHAAGEIAGETLRRVEDDCIREVAKRQEDIGLQGITDGEFRRTFFHVDRSEEHTSELQSLMRISYAVFCLKKKNKQ